MAGTPEQHIYILREKLNDATTALEEETREKTELKTANEQLTAEIRRQQEAYGKLEKHTKACEKATTKAQKEAKNARGHADHLINSQKGQLKSAERRYADASRCLKEWTERYGSVVEKPAEDQHALQLRLFECQSNAELARNHLVSLEEQIQGTPTQIGLHQALEEWEEHQGCSAEFANLEDKVHDGLVLKGKLESDLAASKERYQKAKADLKTLQIKTNQLQQVNKALQGFQGNANQLEQFNKEFQELQIKANQLEQTNKALQDQHDSHDYMLHIQKLESDLKASREQCQITEWDMKALEEKVTQLEQTNEDSRVQDDSDVEMLDDNTLDKAKLESEFKTLQARHQKTQSDMKALQEKADELENDKKAFQDQHESLNDMLQKLQLDQKAGQEQNQENESNRKALQEKADQLESELKSTKEQHQTTKAGMDMLQEKADQLKSDLKTAKEQYQTTKSNMEKLQGKGGQLEQINKALQEKGDQLESDLKTTQEQYHTTKSNMDALQGKADQLESDLRTAQEQYQMTKSNMDVLQGKVEQLEQANATFQEKENERVQIETLEKKEQYEKANNEIAESEQRDTLRIRIGNPEETEYSQVTQPSSPLYTTDEGSQDLESTPRPKKSLRQDLGYSSRDQSDEEQSDVYMPQQQSAMLSRQAETAQAMKEAGAKFWETDDGEDAERHTKGTMGREMKRLLAKERQAKNIEARETRAKERAKEQSEALETLFECTPAKANAIDRRLKALGPGCRLHEAPALVAYELSGIQEETYKGLASGQLIATMPPNEVRDVGTNPEVFAVDAATEIIDLPTNRIAGPIFVAQDMATDTIDLPVEEVTTSHNRFSRRTLFDYLLMLSEILLGLFFLYWLYTELSSDPKPKTQHGLLYQNIYPHRHTPFPTPSRYGPTPIRLVYPPTPAPQLGLARMMKGSSLGGGLRGRGW